MGETPWMAKNHDMVANVVKVLRRAAKLLKNAGPASKEHWAAEISMALPQLNCLLSLPPRRAGSTEPTGEHTPERLSRMRIPLPHNEYAVCSKAWATAGVVTIIINRFIALIIFHQIFKTS